ncbi:phosphatase PAP2 family protein [Actinocorallia populi]|uniref:phosphatase PAP2 family protein n=1 Tax=Actinocorallia populi TaxID=2079200 RepID=UPI001E581BCA|nr:phosphatase PAP2 family protein [Actinocorallia populi]
MLQIAPPPPKLQGVPVTGGGADVRPVIPAVRTPPVWRELLLIAFFYAAYMATRVILDDPDGPQAAFRNALRILDWERAAGLDVELGLNRMLLEHQWLATAANLFYLSAHFVVTIGVVAWLYRSRPLHYAWLRTGIMAATGLALIGFWLFPLAPPRFLPEHGFVDPVVFFDTPGLYSSGASTAMSNQYAAMPSMHAGWALWCGIALALLGRAWWVRTLGVLYPVVTVLVIMATANHYVLDAVAGAAVILLATGASWLVHLRRRGGRAPV